ASTTGWRNKTPRILSKCGQLLNLTSFYMCPASNPGKQYCNYPRHYYCAYWGCETIASAWAPGGGLDKYLKVGHGPAGCKRPQEWPWTGKNLLGNCTFLYLNVTQPSDSGWLIGKTWGVRHWIEGHDPGNLIQIKKEVAPHDPSPIGPNPVISNDLKESNKTRDNVVKSNKIDQEPQILVQKYTTLWKIMQATFGVLNHTYPNLTKGCWLCYMINPPFYEAIGITSEAREINGTNPKECLWGKGRDSVSGITLSQVSGQGRCVGKVPADMQHLCNTTVSINRTNKPSDWLMPAVNTKW
uniref:Envelope glycoprotein n=1 Tax=Taeniopygia guttata TaxID=59729 RepID=A0A674GBQ9_TAEGU